MDKDIATLLEEIRTESGWSQARIACELGTTQPTVNRLLRGQQNCMANTMLAIRDLHQKLMKRRRRKRAASH